MPDPCAPADWQVLMPTVDDHSSHELESDFFGFHRLMPHRVEDVLLVCSLYESFILEEDGLVADLISSEYLEMNLSHAPRVARVSTGEEALALMKTQSFDLVITMTRLGDWDVCDFAAAVKEMHRQTAVVVLADDPRDLVRYRTPDKQKDVDQFFVWSGDAKILLAIVKYIEDRLNAAHDTTVGNVRVILLIEDSVKFYSAYLPLIYSELMKLTQKLMAEGVNHVQRLLRMRARPKILHATSFEEAWNLYVRYSASMLGVITDVRFPRLGELDPQAGLDFAMRIKDAAPLMPVLLQSSNVEMAPAAAEIGAGFADKNSRTLLQDVRDFLLLNLGFGEFVFRLPDGREVGRATDLRSLAEGLEHAPDESILFHADSNHFSNWLMARTEFELASMLRPQRVSDFEDLATLRAYLVKVISDAYEKSQASVIADFSRQQFSTATAFARISGGAMGGKARGLAFINALLDRYRVHRQFEGVKVSVPRSAAIGTDAFDQFLDGGDLRALAASEAKDQEIVDAFISAKLPRKLMRDLAAFLDLVRYPLAVRSSSLLEDSHGQPFAGIYQTYMIPNNHRNPRVRLQQLSTAIKLVYASTFSNAAKRYLEATNHRIEEEKMGVILQQLVGSQHDDRFYPNFSGVARSYNFYPFGKVKPEDGVACVALGLGKSVVEGEEMLMFSPAHPQSLPQFATTEDALANSQRGFYSLDMSCSSGGVDDILRACVDKHGLDLAEADGTLAPVGSVYSPENNALYDGIGRPGPRLVTFAHVLKSGIFPLAEIIKLLLRLGQRGMACPVELEFAVNMQTDPMQFGVLQIRPIVADEASEVCQIEEAEIENACCHSRQTMGNGTIRGLSDLIYVDPDQFQASRTREIAGQISLMNARLTSEGRRYILIGPGRWGSADPWLGVPVTWEQVSSAQVIVETSLKDFLITPSQGTHFFQNLASFRIGYLTVNPTAGGGFVDWDWLASQKAVEEVSMLRRLRLDQPLEVRLDGRTRQGVILKPGESPPPE